MCFNPIDHLMTYRKLCKLGGLVVIETAVAVSDEVSFFHVIRPEETLYGGGATWFVTTAAIDLFMRACFLATTRVLLCFARENSRILKSLVSVSLLAPSADAHSIRSDIRNCQGRRYFGTRISRGFGLQPS